MLRPPGRCPSSQSPEPCQHMLPLQARSSCCAAPCVAGCAAQRVSRLMICIRAAVRSAGALFMQASRHLRSFPWAICSHGLAHARLHAPPASDSSTPDAMQLRLSLLAGRFQGPCAAPRSGRNQRDASRAILNRAVCPAGGPHGPGAVLRGGHLQRDAPQQPARAHDALQLPVLRDGRVER
jgi:hypothetical protein